MRFRGEPEEVYQGRIGDVPEAAAGFSQVSVDGAILSTVSPGGSGEGGDRKSSGHLDRSRNPDPP